MKQIFLMLMLSNCIFGCGSGTGLDSSQPVLETRRATQSRYRTPFISLVVLDGQDSISKDNLINVVIPEVKYRYAQIGLKVRFRIKKVKYIAAPDDDFVTTYNEKNFRGQLMRQLDLCHKLHRKRGRRNRVKLCIFPPMHHHETRYVAGMGWVSGYGRSKPEAIAQCENINAEGKDRVYACAVIIAHELGHTFGAGHITTEPNLMDSHAANYWDDPAWIFQLAFVEKTKEQINKHIKMIRMGR